MQRSDFRCLHRLRVRCAEVDMQKIVFNAHYLMYIDTAMSDYWRALALPYESKSNARFENKAVLKDLLTRLAPHYKIDTPKRGFSFPLKDWLRNHWKDQVLSTVNQTALTDMGLDAKPFMDIVNRFFRENSNGQVEVWYLFNLFLWKENFDRITTMQM